MDVNDLFRHAFIIMELIYNKTVKKIESQHPRKTKLIDKCSLRTWYIGAQPESRC